MDGTKRACAICVRSVGESEMKAVAAPLKPLTHVNSAASHCVAVCEVKFPASLSGTVEMSNDIDAERSFLETLITIVLAKKFVLPCKYF